MVKCKIVNFESESSSLSPGAYKSPYKSMGICYLLDISKQYGIIIFVWGIGAAVSIDLFLRSDTNSNFVCPILFV